MLPVQFMVQEFKSLAQVSLLMSLIREAMDYLQEKTLDEFLQYVGEGLEVSQAVLVTVWRFQHEAINKVHDGDVQWMVGTAANGLSAPQLASL